MGRQDWFLVSENEQGSKRASEFQQYRLDMKTYLPMTASQPPVFLRSSPHGSSYQNSLDEVQQKSTRCSR